MKIAKMSFVWFMVSLALGALLIVKWNNEKRQSLKIEQLQLQVEESTKAERLAQTRADEQQRAFVKVQSELRASEMETYQAKQKAMIANQTNAAAASQGTQPGTAQNQPANTPSGGNPIAQMLKDPEMRKMIQAQQNAMMSMMYGPLYKRLGLTPEESERMKAILSDAQSKATENAAALLSEDGQSKQEAIKAMTAQQQEAQRQLKELLGDDRFSKYQEYSQTLGERMLMNQFQQQHNLAPEKVDQMLDLIRQEKQAAQIPDMNSPEGSQLFQEMVNQPDAIERLIEQQKLMNNRVVQRAGTVLSPEELKDFTEFQENQSQLQQFGLETAAKMFRNPNGQGNLPPPST